MSAVTEALAAEILDAWHDISKPCAAQPWASAPEEQRRGARTMVAMAMAAGKGGERSRESVAAALCSGFAQDCVARGRPNEAWLRWETCGAGNRSFWLLIADRFLTRAQALKAERRKEAA